MDKRKILLVDDDDSVLLYLTAKLGKDFDVVSTVDPTRAAGLARTHLPDVIFCDTDMPEMSGGDVVRALEEDSLTARIPFIYLTTTATPSEAGEMDIEVGGKPEVSKRAQLAELLERINEVTKR